jgi:hypothetical protein
MYKLLTSAFNELSLVTGGLFKSKIVALAGSVALK